MSTSPREPAVPASHRKPITLPQLAEMKGAGEPIVMVTAYDAPGARFAEDAGVDIVPVGDTAAMVVLGYDGTTVPVTMDEMLFLTRTVGTTRISSPSARSSTMRVTTATCCASFWPK